MFFVDFRSLDTSLRLDSGTWTYQLLYIKHFSDLHSRTFGSCQTYFRLLFLDNRFMQLLFFIVNKRYRFRCRIDTLIAFWESIIVQMSKKILCFSERVYHLLKDAFFVGNLLFPFITLVDQSVVFCLVLSITEMYLFIGFVIEFLEKIHVINQIIFIGLQLFFYFDLDLF
jgi:hypothetical protein